MEQQRNTDLANISPVAPAYSVTNYEDFLIVLWRKDARTVRIRVEASPAGRMAKPVTVAFPDEEGATLRGSFVTTGNGHSGRALIKPEEAAEIGERLAHVLFPAPVFRLLAESLRKVVARPHRGLRIRLNLDASLVDLPWEYTYRPDRLGKSGISGFLLLDPTISMVRQAANPFIKIEPITGRQRLSFVGTLWEGKRDGWEVRQEFDLLTQGLKPVKRYIEPKFANAKHVSAFSPKQYGEAAIFHYAGHCDFDNNGRAYVLRELPTSRRLSITDMFYMDALAPALANVGTRLVVMSACNSGYWAAVRPLLNEGIPSVIGVNFGEIMSELSKRRVLILGRFTGRRLKVLEAIKMHLKDHPNNYIPELFTFAKPELRDLVESIIGFAALSRFIIADLSEPKSIQSELEAIVPRFQSVPVVPLINETGKEYATFSSLQRRNNVVKPTVRYLNIDDLKVKIDEQVVPLAKKTLAEVQFGW